MLHNGSIQTSSLTGLLLDTVGDGNPRWAPIPMFPAGILQSKKTDSENRQENPLREAISLRPVEGRVRRLA